MYTLWLGTQIFQDNKAFSKNRDVRRVTYSKFITWILGFAWVA